MKKALLALVLFACASAAFCQTAPKPETPAPAAAKATIDFTQQLVDFEDNKIAIPLSPNSPKDAKPIPVTLYDIVRICLSTRIDALDGRDPDPVQIEQRDALANYIYHHKADAELTATDLAMLVKRVKASSGLFYPGVSGAWISAAVRALDPLQYKHDTK